MPKGVRMSVVSIDSRECACSGPVFRSATAGLVGEISRERLMQAGKWGDGPKVPRNSRRKEGLRIARRYFAVTNAIDRPSAGVSLNSLAATNPDLDRNFRPHSEGP
jgi:hypothetical protein